jgi:hypothetical protein
MPKRHSSHANLPAGSPHGEPEPVRTQVCEILALLVVRAFRRSSLSAPRDSSLQCLIPTSGSTTSAPRANKHR